MAVKRYVWDADLLGWYDKDGYSLQGKYESPVVLAADHNAAIAALTAELKKENTKIDRMLGYHVEDEKRIADLEAQLANYRKLEKKCAKLFDKAELNRYKAAERT